MLKHVSIFLFTITLFGCSDMGEEPAVPAKPLPTDHTSVVPGVIGVIFKPGTTVEQAEQLVKDLNLEFKFRPSGDPVNGTISVPVGFEDWWVAQFKTYSIVHLADRVWVTFVT